MDRSAPRPAALSSRAPLLPRLMLPALALALAALALVALAGCDAAVRLFGPPQVQMREAYRELPDGPTFDHSALDAVLERHVDADGWVDYAALSEAPGELDGYLASLAEAPFDDLGRDEKLALLINAYNAFTLRLILDHYPLGSIQDIPDDQRWDGRRFDLGGRQLTLNEIEHQEIRPKFRAAEIHFAVNCASVGCPPLRREAYTGERIDEQLADQARTCHRGDRWFRFDRAAGVVQLTKLYQWYGGDFEQVAGSPLEFAAGYAPQLEAALAAGEQPEVRWLDYSWQLNSQENADSL